MIDKNKTKELEWNKTIQNSVNRQIDLITIFYSLKTPQDLEKLLTQQRTELEQQKVKVVWNDVCEQIKKEARTELLEEIKTRVNTWGGFEDGGGNLCHYDSEILEWVNDLLNKKL